MRGLLLSEDKTINWVTNLEWLSSSDNCDYGTRNKRISESLRKNTNRLKKMFTEMNVARGYSVSQYKINGDFVYTYSSIPQAAQHVGVDSTCISKCCKGQQKQQEDTNGNLRRKETSSKWGHVLTYIQKK